METVIEMIKRNGFTAHICYDSNPMNPRKDWDNIGKIVSRKLTSDEEFEFSGDKERDIKRLKQEFGATVILPIYMYSHGCKRVNPATRSKVKQLFIDEIKTYDQYIRGEVYGYVLFDKTGNEIDSC